MKSLISAILLTAAAATAQTAMHEVPAFVPNARESLRDQRDAETAELLRRQVELQEQILSELRSLNASRPRPSEPSPQLSAPALHGNLVSMQGVCPCAD